MAERPGGKGPGPVGGSRTGAARPRRLAGQGESKAAPTEADPLQPAAVEPETVEPAPQPGPPAENPAYDRPAHDSAHHDSASRDADPGEPQRHGLAHRPATTIGLVVAIVLLLGAAVVLGNYVWFAADPVPSSSRPVVTGEISGRMAVDAARKDVADILSYGHRDFDQQIADAQKMMTPGFASRFADTAAGVKDQFVANRTEQKVNVRAAGIVQASDAQVQVLLFLDQFVTKGSEDKRGAGKAGARSPADYTPYRAMVTMVDTEHGWLVDNIETR